MSAVVIALVLLLQYRGSASLQALSQSDDGVHLSSAISLIHGQLPYRDFAFLQPPGITLLLTPFALLAKGLGQPATLGLARLLMVVVALSAARLLWLLCAGPWWWRVAVVALFALSADVLIAEQAVLLEPFVCLATLGGLLVLERGALSTTACIWAGVVFGLGAEFKLFVLTVPLAVAAIMLISGRVGRAIRHLGAALVTFAAIMAPFFLAAPGAAWRDVVSTQSDRPADGLVGSQRLTNVLGLNGWHLHAPQALLVVFLVGCVALACVMAGRDTVGRMAVFALVLTGIAFCLSDTFFNHYGAFPVCLMGAVFARAGRRLGDRSPGVRPLLTLALSAVLAAQVLGAWTFERPNPAATEFRGVPRHVTSGCVVGDSVSLLIAADSYAPTAADCPGWVDGRGYALTLLHNSVAHFYPDGFRAIAAWQAQELTQLQHADALYLIFDPMSDPEWGPSVTSYFTAHFRLLARYRSGAPWEVWARDPTS